ELVDPWFLHDQLGPGLDDDFAALAMDAILHADIHWRPRWIQILEDLWRVYRPAEAASICEHVIATADLSDPLSVQEVLQELDRDERPDLVAMLLRRNPAECVALTEPFHIGGLPEVLVEC